GDGASSRRIKRSVECDNASEGRERIACQCLAIGLNEALGFGDPARVGVLDDHTSRGADWIKFGDALVGGIGVVEIIERQVLALNLAGGGNTKPPLGGAIERGRLMRVLAITERLGEPAAKGPPQRRWVAEPGGKPRRYRRVISGRASIRLG